MVSVMRPPSRRQKERGWGCPSQATSWFSLYPRHASKTCSRFLTCHMSSHSYCLVLEPVSHRFLLCCSLEVARKLTAWILYLFLFSIFFFKNLLQLEHERSRRHFSIHSLTASFLLVNAFFYRFLPLFLILVSEGKNLNQNLLELPHFSPVHSLELLPDCGWWCSSLDAFFSLLFSHFSTAVAFSPDFSSRCSREEVMEW